MTRSLPVELALEERFLDDETEVVEDSLHLHVWGLAALDLLL